jgi:hypothetical protein
MCVTAYEMKQNGITNHPTTVTIAQIHKSPCPKEPQFARAIPVSTAVQSQTPTDAQKNQVPMSTVQPQQQQSTWLSSQQLPRQI